MIFLTVCLFIYQQIPQSYEFWLIATVVAGLVNMAAWLLKVQAFKYEHVSRVSPIFYLECVFGLFLDYFAFSTQFDLMQICGIILVFSMFTAKLVYACK